LRLRLRKEQARAGDIHLLFADESEALTHPYLAQAWAPRGADLRVEAPGQAKKVAILGALDAITWEVVVHTARTKRSTDFIALLERIDERYGPRPGAAGKPVVLVLDNGPVHTSKLTTQALADRRPWLTVEWLPKYAPELNDIERVWRDLKRHHLAHRTFTDADQLERDVQSTIGERNRERAHLCDNPRIAA
jgi:transposase